MHTPGKCLLLLVLLLVIVVYPRAKAITSFATPGWTELSIVQQCSYAHHQTSSPWLYTSPTYIICIIFTAVYRLYDLAIAFFDIAIFQTLGLLPLMPITGTPASQTQISNGKRDSSASYFKQIRRQDQRICDSDNTKVSDCINKTTSKDVIWVIVAGVIIGVFCLIFTALLIRHLRKDNKKAKVSSVLKKEKKSSSSSANQVGLGRGLGSDGVGKDRGLRTVSLGEQEMNLGTRENTEDELVTSTWNENALKHFSSSWNLKRLLHVGQPVSTEAKENNHLAPPTGPLPPRLPTPNLPGTLNMSSDATGPAMPATGKQLRRKPLIGLEAFTEEDFARYQDGVFVGFRANLQCHIPEIRVTDGTSDSTP